MEDGSGGEERRVGVKMGAAVGCCAENVTRNYITIV